MAELSRRERKKLETRRKIFEAAFSLMSEHGYDGVKVEHICEAADVANATFFTHFPTKASLITAYNEMITEKIAQQLNEFELPAMDKMELLRGVSISEWQSQSELLRAIVGDASNNKKGTVPLMESNASLLALAQSIIEDGQQSGDFKTQFPADLVALSLVSSWTAIVIEWSKTGDGNKARAAHRDALDLILYGLL